MEQKFSTISEYISSFPMEAAQLLETMRRTIQKAAPEAQETISYNMPAFRLHGILVYFAAHKEHIGFYPAQPGFLAVFRNQLEGYHTSKGTIQFLYRDGIPVKLVEEIVRYRVVQNLEKVQQKKTRKK